MPLEYRGILQEVSRASLLLCLQLIPTTDSDISRHRRFLRPVYLIHFLFIGIWLSTVKTSPDNGAVTGVLVTGHANMTTVRMFVWPIRVWLSSTCPKSH